MKPAVPELSARRGCFSGANQKTEEEDGMNRKPDDEYQIRYGFLKGIGEDSRNIVEAIVVLPGNVFYGTTIPGAMVFFNKAKPASRAGKVLMIYAAREGWCKETPDQNVLLPHDMLRILIQLLSWGDIKVAKKILPQHKARLYADIQDRLEYERSEIQLHYRDEEREQFEVSEKLKDIKLKKAERDKLEKRLVRLDADIVKMNQALADAETSAQQERDAVDRVETELLEMFADPDLRKRYFAIVDMNEIEENEFNLNIPRYVETFEPEEEISLSDALTAFKTAQSQEEFILKQVDKMIASMPSE